jgi:hypothetical protein
MQYDALKVLDILMKLCVILLIRLSAIGWRLIILFVSKSLPWKFILSRHYIKLSYHIHTNKITKSKRYHFPYISVCCDCFFLIQRYTSSIQEQKCFSTSSILCEIHGASQSEISRAPVTKSFPSQPWVLFQQNFSPTLSKKIMFMKSICCCSASSIDPDRRMQWLYLLFPEIAQ